MSARAEGERTAQLLGLEELPGKGGLFRQTYADAHSSVIYFMLIAPDFSALHALRSVEVYHWYAGAPLQMLLPHPGGQTEQPVLGPDVATGARPQIVVPVASAGVLVLTALAGPPELGPPVRHASAERPRWARYRGDFVPTWIGQTTRGMLITWTGRTGGEGLADRTYSSRCRTWGDRRRSGQGCSTWRHS